MALYSFDGINFSAIEKTNFTKEAIYERQHIQSALAKKIEVILDDVIIISEEFSEWVDSQRRIDLLAIDKDANLVVIELKRTDTGELMELQAIRYAAMVSTLTFKRTVEIYQVYLNRKGLVDENAEQKILEFLSWDEPQEDSFAINTKIVLVSNDFSKEFTTSVMWLNNSYGMDIKCLRLVPYKHGNQTLIDVQQIIPLPEAESYQIKIRQQSEERKVARESSKDYTQYVFEGASYSKRKLVFAVVSKWVELNKPQSIQELEKVFSMNKLFVPIQKAKDTYQRQGIYRHFLEENEIFKFPNGELYALSNQWGSENIEKFLKLASLIGLEITAT
ncbi:MAG: hypothetical protein HOO90_11370 [Methylotenera sp.]|uniref:hypothetical protein n=1 Tax=Methylotenera sp. TaxID=2051956 RepID=UPI0017BED627|nr:hypothetical protein [Methylotenera sp.]NOU26121.1 hypothetical protein [Methylotenera sp.]